MRVGLRRLRAASSLFKEMLHDRETQRIKRGLAWLTEQLGPARDYEVMLSESIDPLQGKQPDRPDLRLLQRDFKGERDWGYAIAKAAVASPRYRHIILDTALWLLDGEWQRNHDALRTALREVPVSAFARDELKRRARKIAQTRARTGGARPAPSAQAPDCCQKDPLRLRVLRSADCARRRKEARTQVRSLIERPAGEPRQTQRHGRSCPTGFRIRPVQ